MTRPTLLHLSAEEVRRALPMPQAVAVMRDAFRQLACDEVTLPARTRLDTPHSVALVMPCYSRALQFFSLKFITLCPHNAPQGLPLIQSIVLLNDGRTGEPLAIMDGASLTAIRTGAAVGLATDLLARPEATTVAIIGTGIQARTQLAAIHSVRRLRQAFVYDPLTASAEKFAVDMRAQIGIPIERAASAAAAVSQAEIICTATTSSVPVFDDHDVSPGTHINAIGVFQPDRAEVPAATVRRARVVVDHYPSAREEAGDLLQPLAQGLIGEDHFAAELGQLVLGKQPGRTAPAEITLFKSVGVAIQDLCAAAHALANARELGLGTSLPR
jgi:ornithine cyclodeaminase/alanine dehydrogenase-like protein (mu-crystallin family)